MLLNIDVTFSNNNNDNNNNNNNNMNISVINQCSNLRGKYQPKMIRPCDWTFETKVIIVCDSFFRKPISIVHCLSLL